MKKTLLIFSASMLTFSLVLIGCNSNDSAANAVNASAQNANLDGNSNVENSALAKDDVDELGKIIQLPIVPEEATYWIDSAAKQDDSNQKNTSGAKTLVAVLKYSPEKSAELSAELEKIKLPVDARIDADNRFPAELIARSQLSGDETLKGKTYSATNFTNSPYKKGKITRIEDTNYFVLELNTE